MLHTFDICSCVYTYNKRIFPAKNVPRQFSMLHGNRIEIRVATVGVIFEQIEQAESTLMPWHKKHMQCGNGLRSAHTRAMRGEGKRPFSGCPHIKVGAH